MDREFIAIMLAFGLALVPVWIVFRTRAVRTALVLSWIAVAIGITPALALYRSMHVVVEPDHRPVERLREDYVGSKECIACHPREYDTWKHSFHRTMTQLASPESVFGDFDDVQLEWHGQRIELTRSGDQFFTSVYDSNAKKYVSREIVMTTGSHHMQIYWYSTGPNRPLQQLPIAYLKNDQKWVPILALFITPPSATLNSQPGMWNNSCIHCHTTRGRPMNVDGLNAKVDTDAVEFGIACEACHGPGEEHIRANRSNPARRYASHVAGDGDDTIVNAARLLNERSTEVCGQCHGISAAASSTEIFVDGYEFRAGEVLDETGRLIMRGGPNVSDPSTEIPEELHDFSFWSDGMVRVSGRELNGMYETPCFQAREMTCLSCHKLHKSDEDPRSIEQWADDMLAPEMRTNQACLQCHQSFGDDLESHTHHAEGSSGSECMNCHMPYTTWGLLKSMRQHTVDSPSVRSDLEVGRPNACNACHIDQTLEWTAKRMASWYDHPIPQMSDDESSVAASILWLLKGDAGQRALAAWYLGWEPAQAVAGSDWIAPPLAPLLQDPYDVVRYIAARSLRTLEGFGNLDYDWVGEESTRKRATQKVWAQFAKQNSGREGSPSHATLAAAERLLLYPDGSLDRIALGKLLDQRDDRDIFLNE